ncbi:MAG: DUF3810 domain-containing protein [Clostridia bacterium]|nr:DUF3810 domain-containing protein [Clostridia bacterium]
MRNYGRKKAFSAFAMFSFIVTGISLVLLMIAKSSVCAADFLNSTVSYGYRRVMAAFGELFPFSLFELLLALLPIIIIVVVILAVRAFKRGGGLRFVINFVSVLLLLYSGNVIALGIGYNTTTVDKRIGFEICEVNKDNLAEVMTALRDEVNALCPLIEYDENGISKPDYTLRESGEIICDAYKEISEKYGFLGDFSSTPKGVGLLNIMSYLSLGGIYTYYTGEANVNIDYPMYDVVFTAGHELSHQRGVMRENEANFMAYFVLSSSPDTYLCYSAALNMYSYISSALYRTDPDLYYSIARGLDARALSDLRASSAISREYGDTILSDISNFVNDLFLKSHGTDGVVTYGRVVTLTVSYFKSKK